MAFKSYLITGVILLLIALPLFADTHTVTNCADAGAGSLKKALADSSSGDTIIFNISTLEAGYSTGEAGPGLVTNEAIGDTWFRIMTSGVWTSNNNLIISGSSQPIGEANNSQGPRIEIRTRGNGISISSNYTTVEGLVLNPLDNVFESYGLYYSGSANHNSVLGCYIGITATGEGATPNQFYHGINLNGGSYNVIGGTAAGQRNIIANVYPNGGDGITINSTSTSNEIIGNYIGVDRTGNASLGTKSNNQGVKINSSLYNKIGKAVSGGGNVISGLNVGIYASTTANSNEVMGNYFGLNAAGDAAIPNSTAIMLAFYCSFNKIGDGTTAGRNIISGNNIGINITGSTGDPGTGSNSNEVKGNYIGLNAGGLGTVATNQTGIMVSNCSQFNLIGGETSEEGNVIAGNTGAVGVYIGNTLDPTVTDNVVKNNLIGTNQLGTVLGNYYGVQLSGCGTNDVINNTIVCNGFGIYITSAMGCRIKGNVIGSIAPAYPSGKGNTQDGIYLDRNAYYPAGYNQIGGTGAGEENVIVGNGRDGINIAGSVSGGCATNEIVGNYIGVTPTYAVLANASHGINIYNSADNIIGGTVAGAGNVIAGNAENGLNFSQAGATNNQIKGNYIGVDKTASVNLANTKYGVAFASGAYQNSVGPNNYIADNGWHGISIDGSATIQQWITRNSLFSNGWGGISLSNGGNSNLAPPVIASAFINAAGTTEIKGSAAPANGTVELFKAQGGEGKTYLGAATADGSGNFDLLVASLNPGDPITVTGTKNGIPETSAFSSTIEVLTASYQADGMIGKEFSGSDYAYEGTWEAVPAAQIRTLTLPANQKATFYFKLKNAGNVPDYLHISAEAASGSFEVHYYDSKTGSTEITGSITGEGTISPLLFTPGASLETRVEITYLGNALATEEIVYTVASTTDAAKLDRVKAVATFTPLNYQADLMIGTNYDGSDYATEGTWETYPVNQVKHLSVPANQTAIYYFKIKNAGEVEEYLRISGEAGRSPFQVRYFGSKDGADEIQITGEGSVTPFSLVPGASVEGRVEVNYFNNTLATSEIIMTAVSSKDSSKKDLVKAVATFTPVNYRPDIMIGTLETGTDYAYQGVYESTPATQIKRLTVPANGTAVYYYKIYNAGDDADLRLSGEAGSGNLTVTYYGDKVGGSDITSQIIGAGLTLEGYPAGASAEVRFEVSYSGSVAATREVSLTFISTNDGTKVDRIKSITTFAAPTYQADLMVGTLESLADAAYENVFEDPPVTQVRTRSVATNETATLYFKVKNAGEAIEAFHISAEAVSGLFAVRYFDVGTTAEITGQITGEGTITPFVLAPGGSWEGRMAVTYSGNAAATKEVILTLVSTHEPSKKDLVKAIASFTPIVTPPSPPISGEVASFSVSAPSDAMAGASFAVTLIARNAYGTQESNVYRTVQFAADAGSITPITIAPSDFIGGAWTGNVVLGKPGRRTITATSGSANGSAIVLVTNGTREFTATELGVHGMSILIPGGIATEEVTISVSEVTPPPAAPPIGYKFGGKVYDVTCNVSTFSLPVTVTFPLDGGLADPRIYFWNGSAWSRDGLSLLSSNNSSMVFQTSHLSIFAPMGAAADNLVRFGPNPFNPNAGGGRFWYWLTADKETSLYLIDLGGTVVWKQSFTAGTNGGKAGENNLLYDGKTNWGDLLGNGVYLYKVVQDGKSIGGGKIAIIK